MEKLKKQFPSNLKCADNMKEREKERWVKTQCVEGVSVYKVETVSMSHRSAGL